MERKKAGLRCAGAGLGLLILIFDSGLALNGARDGIRLCSTTVIPSLFPFFVLSMLFTNSMGSCPPSGFLTGCLGIPPAAASVIIPAFLGGYPVGAKCVADLYRNRWVSREEAERLLAFCSNAGPSFLFGMVSQFFPERKLVWLLWGIHIVSAVLTALVIPAGKQTGDTAFVKETNGEQSVIWSAAKAMCQVCCWVILFRMVITFLNAWLLWLFPVWLQVLLTGLLELTNGCCALGRITDRNLRFILCACMLSFGGICVLLQTFVVAKGLRLSGYIRGKCLQTVFSLILSVSVILEGGWLLPIVLLILLTLLRKSQNKCRNPGMLPV